MNATIKTIIRLSLCLLSLSSAGVLADPAVFKDCPDCPDMVALPAGRFTMGSPGKNAEQTAQPAHSVNVKAFAIGKFEVTQDEWFAVMGTRPAQFKGGRHPVEQVTWKLAREFTRKLSEKTGKKYRLPTEAEWEYAARGGTDSEFYFGQSSIADHAWFDDNSDETTHAVGQKNPIPMACMTSTAMSGNGLRIAGTRATLAHPTTAARGPAATAVSASCAAAPGTASRRPLAPPSGRSSPPKFGTAAVAADSASCAKTEHFFERYSRCDMFCIRKKIISGLNP